MAKKNKHLPRVEAALQGQIVPMPDGGRHVNLTIAEREQLARNRLIEGAVALFLDLDTDRTWQQVADTLGISLAELKRLTKDPDFVRIHEESLAQVGHDPRLRTVVSQLSDLLPLAFRTVKAMMGDGIQDQTRLKAALEVMRMNKVEQSAGGDDPRELRTFLQRNGVTVEGDLNIMKLNIPPQYVEAFKKYFPSGEIVDVQGRDIAEGENNTPDSGDRIQSLPAEVSVPGGEPAPEAEASDP